MRILETGAVPGRSLAEATLFPDWSVMKDLPVIADSYDQPILYYAANTHGSEANMLSQNHRQDHDYSSEGGPPAFFHREPAERAADTGALFLCPLKPGNPTPRVARAEPPRASSGWRARCGRRGRCRGPGG